MSAQENTYFSIKETSKILQVSSATLRLWERQGKITPHKNKEGQRIYSKDQIDFLKIGIRDGFKNLNIEKIAVEKPTQKTYYSITQVSKYLKVSPATLRLWETQGKVIPVRDSHDHRVYTNKQILDLKDAIANGFGKHKTDVIKRKVKVIQQKHNLIQAASLAGGIAIAGLLFVLGIYVFDLTDRKIDKEVLSSSRTFADAIDQTLDDQKQLLGNVLGERNRPTDFWFYINVPTNIGNELVVEGDAIFEGNITTPGVDLLGTGTLAGLAGVDATSATTLQNTLVLGGDLEGNLANTSLAETIEYDGELTVTNIVNITGELQADGDEGSDEQVLTSTGSGVEWLDITDLTGDLTDAETLDSLDSTEFLRSNASDEFTSGVLSFSDGTFLDLSSIAQNDTAAQGLKLPQSTSLVAPGTGEGYLAYDTATNKIQVYNGFAWVDVTGASNSLQNAYEYGNTIQLSATEGDITFRNDSNEQMMFFDEDTARVGIGTITPQYKLDVSGDVRVASSSDIYLEGEALRATQLGDRQYTYDMFVTDSETMTASIDALDTQVRNLTLGTAGLWTDAGTVTYMTSDVDDVVIGGTTLASSVFGIDESAGTFYYGADGSVNPTMIFEAVGGDVGTFGFNGNDAFYITGANLGIGKVDPSYALDINGEFNATTIYIGGTAITSTATELNILDGTTISTSELNLLTGRTGTLVDSNNVGSYATTAVDAGAGLTDGGTVGSVTVNVGQGSGINVTADAVSLGDLTTSWVQSAAYDITLNNANSELKILESVGGTYFGIMDITDLNADRTYTFPDASGNILVTSSAATELSGWDQDVSDDLTGTGSNGQVSYWTGTYSQAGSNDFYWDNGNSRLGIGTTAPAASLDLPGAAAGYASLRINTGSQPSSPAVGDIYAAGTSLYFYDGSTWNDLTSSAGASLFTDGGTVTYLTAETDDFAIGGTTLAASMFGIDESAGTFYLGADNSANPTLEFEATDSDAGTFGFNTNDAFYFNGANVGIGTTNPTANLEITSVNDGEELLRFNTPRPWAFYQRSSGGTTELDLRPTTPQKTFTITNNDGEMVAEFYSGAAFSTDNHIGFVEDRVRITDLGAIGVGTTNPTDELHVVGNTLSTAGYHVGTDSTDSLIDDASNGSGSSTLYIGNESILASGDIGSSVQGYDANTSLIGQTIETGEITDDTILEVDFDATNAPTAGYILSYDSGSGGFTWIANSGGSGASKWTDSGAYTYLTGTTDDVVFGASTTTDAPFWFDVSTSDIVLGGSNTSNNFETTIDVTNPTADRTIVLPDAGGEFSLLGQTISGSEILDDTIEEVDLELTNAATDNYILSYDSASGGFTWINPTGSGVGSLGGGGVTNYITKWTDPSTLGSSVMYETSSKVGIGTTNPGTSLEIRTSTSDDGLQIVNDSTGNIAAKLYKDTTGDWGRFYLADTGSLKIHLTARNGVASYINNAGNFGIGENAPDATLEVVKTATTPLLMLSSNSSGDGDYFYVGNTGSVGIGTTGPSYLLDVAGTFRATGNTYLSGLNTGTDNSVLVLNSSNEVVTDEIDPDVWTPGTLADISSGTTNYLPLWSDADSLGSSAVYQASGLIGIGTTAPGFALHIADTDTFQPILKIEALTTATAKPAIIQLENSANQAWNISNGTSNEFRIDGDNVSTIHIEDGTPSYTLYLDSTGGVGIGKINPATALDVVGSGTFSARLQADTIGIGTGSDAFLDIKAATLSSAQINLTSSSGTDVSSPTNGDFWWNGTNLYFYNGSTSTDLLAGGGTFDGTGVTNYITKFTDADTLTTSAMYEVGGQIGLGTTAPSSTLDVVGSITASTSVITPLISFTGTGTINGLDAVDSTTENTIEGLIFDADAENILGVWEVQDQIAFNFGNEADIQFMYDETTDDRLEISDGTNNFLTIADAGTTATVQINGDDIYVKSDGLVGIGTTDPTQQLDINGDLRIRGGDIYLDPQSTSTATTEGAIYYDDDVDHLYVYGGDAAFHRIALDMTKYTATNSSVSNQSYVEIAHNQSTNDLTVVGWFYDTIDSLWKKIASNDSVATFDFQDEFNPDFKDKKKTDTVTLDYEEDNLGNGADGAITIAGNMDINSMDIISGRSCPDGGDAVNYNVSSLTSTTATLTSTPSAGCLAVGDEMLLINLHGTTTSVTNVGNYETLRIQSISTNVITFTTSKTKYYGEGASDDSNLGTAEGNQKVMLQRVPNYTTVTVPGGTTFYPSDWNGAKSGVMFFRATGTVSISGTLHANSKGYRGGGYYSSWYGGQGGESICADNTYSIEGGGMGGYYNGGNGYTAYCGGGGGGGARGHDSPATGSGSAGTASSGGGGGGGGGAYSSNNSYHSKGGGGGGGGHATAGSFGYGNYNGTAGGVDVSGNGGNGYAPNHAYAGGGGGGGSYTYSNDLTKMRFGSGGGGGGSGEVSQGQDVGGTGGDGGGIIYIAADTVSVGGYITSTGGNGAAGGCHDTTWCGGDGGAGAGGAIKLVGNTLTLGTSKVTAGGGTATGSYGYNGGAGGTGKVATYYSDTISGTTSPTYNGNNLNYNNYGIFISNEIHTPDTTAFNTLSWTEDLDTNGEIQFQTRSGATEDSTDGTWEAWKPVVGGTNETVLETMNTHTNWSGSNATVANGDILRNVDYFEDEDESSSDNLTKVTSTATNGYAEATISSTDISSYDFITFWVRSDATGRVVKLGFGETAGNEQEETFYIDKTNTWQKVHWDISDVAAASRNGVTKLRVTLPTSGTTASIDNIKAASYLTTNGGSTISSTANDYIQYRAILVTTDTQYAPSFSKVEINLTNPTDTYDIDADRIIDPNDGDTHVSARVVASEKLALTNYDLGNGSDGAITVTGNTDINASNLISGRSCADGGDAVNYNVSALTATTATLTTTPATGCLNIDDEVLLINLHGNTTSVSNVGNFETLRVQGISSNVVTFQTSKQKYYGNGLTDDSGLGTAEGNQKVMLQRVPNYTNVTVNGGVNFYPSDWNGAKSGVMYFRATGTVNVAGTIHANSKGYRGGGYYAAWYGGQGGESLCADNTHSVAGGGMGGYYNGTNGYTPYCGGGGGGGSRGHDSPNTGSGSSGTASGGGGGGGGGAYSSNNSYHSKGGGGGGGGHATAGSYGRGANNGTAGGTDVSGNGGAGYAPNHAYGSGGGGGGSFTYDNKLLQLRFGSGGGGGGSGEVSQGQDIGGTGGDGGGIIYIAADTVSVGGYIQSIGGNGASGACHDTTWCGGDGGGGAGGAIKLVGNTLTLGSSKVTATGGTATGSYGYDGGSGGTGKVAVYYESTFSGTTSPTYTVDTTTGNYNNYKVYTSKEISTSGASSFGTISWSETLASNTEIQVQTRSGNSVNSTDGTWEAWKPTTSSTTLETADTHTNWVGSNMTVADGDVTRNVDYYEDEDEGTAGNITKLTSTAASGYAEATISSTDISSRDYLTFWVRSSIAGNSITAGFGEAAGNEQTETINIEQANTWQKVYWDISDVTGTARDGVTKLRITSSPNSNTVYIDNLKAESYLTTASGSSITSSANNYFQYRVILSTTNTLYSPTLGEVWFTYDGNTIYDRTANQNDIDQYDQENRIFTTDYYLNDYQELRIAKSENAITLTKGVNLGTGKDGPITVTGNTDINANNLISGRTCADGGDAINFTVSALTDYTATLTTVPATSCLEPGDEVLLINLQGNTTTFRNVGNYETLFVSSIDGNVVTFKTAKTKYYGNGIADDSGLGTAEGSQKVMLQRIPHYTDVTVPSGTTFYPSDWNGVKGGVLFFRATGTVSIAGVIHANSKGYRGGGYYSTWYGGQGGEAWCADNTYSISGGGMGGHYNGGAGYTPYCGGGGGGGARGHDSPAVGAGSAGTSTGGGGGGGGGTYSSNGSYHSKGGGGGGGGHATAGSFGYGNYNGTAGGVDVSGTGGSGYAPSHAYGGGGGGGGSVTYVNDLSVMRFGSGGGGGGSGEVSQSQDVGGTGGDGGGIIYIEASIIGSGGHIQSIGGNGAAGGCHDTTWCGGDGGGGAGGSIKLVADKMTIGTNHVGAWGGTATGSYGYNGGSGGSGKIGIYYTSSLEGTTSPTAYSAQTPNHSYGVFVSDEFETPDNVDLGRLTWNYDQDKYGLVELQTRTGKSNNSTDNTWEAWKPVVNGTDTVSLNNANTHTDWISRSSSLTVADGDVTRDVNFFEDNDESTASNLTKMTASNSSDMYAETIIDATDISDYDYITMWARSSATGNVIKMGFGETTSNEHEMLFYIDEANKWQKLYWDISNIADHERDGVRNLRVTAESTSYTFYIDNITADRYMTDDAGSNIKSTPNEYIQYRAILTTATQGYKPTLYSVELTWENGYKIVQEDSNTVRLYNYTGETQNLRFEAIVFGADLAEWYTVNNDDIGPGDLVALTGELDDYGVPILRKASTEDSNLIGGISTKAGKELGLEAEDRRLLALAGRIPVKIDPDSEEISPGDSITASDIPGYGRKAALGERAMGTALEKWEPGSIDTEDNKILTLVAPAYTVGTQETAETVLSLEDKVNRISSLLGLESGTEAPGIAAMAEKISSAYDDFVRFTESLGLSTTTNENGESVLAVNSDMTVTGKTSLASVAVLDNLTVGLLEIDATTNEVNVLGASCYNEDTDVHNKDLCEAQAIKLQPDRTGNIDLFDGIIVIEPDGSIILNNVIAQNVETGTLKISDSANAGKATISANSDETWIESTDVTENSLIFVTPTTDTDNAELYIKYKESGNGFTVGTTQTLDRDIEFNWIIVESN